MPLKSAVNSDEMVKKIIIIFYREFQGTRKTSLKDIKKGALIFLVLKWTGLDFFFESQRSQHEKGTKHNTMNMDDGMKESISRGIRLEWYRKCYFSSCCSHTWSHLAILLMMCWCVMTPWMKERKSTYAKDTSRNEWSRRPLPSKEKKMLFSDGHCLHCFLCFLFLLTGYHADRIWHPFESKCVSSVISCAWMSQLYCNSDAVGKKGWFKDEALLSNSITLLILTSIPDPFLPLPLKKIKTGAVGRNVMMLLHHKTWSVVIHHPSWLS